MLKLNLKVWGSNPQRRRSGDLLDMRGLSAPFSNWAMYTSDAWLAAFLGFGWESGRHDNRTG